MNRASLASRTIAFDQRSRSFRNARTGRFASTTEAAELTFGKPHGHSSCGKGQYKSLECKRKAIAKAALGGKTLTDKQKKYLYG